MPGNRPPSATPNRARTVIQLPKFRMKPRHMAITPQKKVKHGSQTRGVTFFRTRLLGSSLEWHKNVREIRGLCWMRPLCKEGRQQT